MSTRISNEGCNVKKISLWIAKELLGIFLGSILAAWGIFYVRNTYVLLTGGGTGIAMMIQDVVIYLNVEGVNAITRVLQRMGANPAVAVDYVNWSILIVGVIGWGLFKYWKGRFRSEVVAFTLFILKTLLSMRIIYRVLGFLPCIFEHTLPSSGTIAIFASFVFIVIVVLFADIMKQYSLKYELDSNIEHFGFLISCLRILRKMDVLLTAPLLLLAVILGVLGYFNIENLVTVALSGILIGGGMALIYNFGGASSGGTDTLSLIIAKCTSKRHSQIIMRSIDVFVLIIGFFVAIYTGMPFAIERVVYSLVLVVTYGICFEVIVVRLKDSSKFNKMVLEYKKAR